MSDFVAKGIESCQDGKFEKGVEYFDKALNASPTDLLALANRARALSRIDRLADSLKDFEKLVSLQPTNAQFLGDYAVALHLNDRNEEAAIEFDKAQALEPQNPYRYSSRAFFKDRIGDHEGAIADYDKCIELDPEDAIALNNRGLVEEKLGYKERSKKSFDQSNELVGYDPDEQAGDKPQISKPKSQKAISEIAPPTTRWSVIKSVFTKEGFSDFLSFYKDKIKPKK